MALTLGTNAYVTLAAANSYFTDSALYDSWNPVNSTVKMRNIMTASQQISMMLQTTCKLPIVVEDINTKVAQATAELALAFILKPALITGAGTGKNVKKVSATSGTDVEFFRDTKVINGQRFPTQVMNILKDSGCLGGSGAAKYAGAQAVGLGPDPVPNGFVSPVTVFDPTINNNEIA